MITTVSPELFRKLQMVLDHCGPLDSDRQLHLAFIDPRLHIWANLIPDNNANRLERRNALMDKLGNRRNSAGDNGLVLFLRVLGEATDPGDECSGLLLSTADELATYLQKEVADPVITKETPRQRTGFTAEQQADSVPPAAEETSREPIVASAGAVQLRLEPQGKGWQLRAQNMAAFALRHVNVVFRPPVDIAVNPNQIRIGRIESNGVSRPVSLVIRPRPDVVGELAELGFEVVYLSPDKPSPERQQGLFQIPLQ